MEDKALSILRTMLSRRGLDTKTERIVSEDLERVNMFTVGNVLVIFSQKDKGLVERDIRNFIAFAEANDYRNGIVIVALSAPSENVLKVVKSFAKERVQFFHIRQLQFDITTHRMAVPHRILNEDEKTGLFQKFKIVNPAEQLPSIDSQDTMVKWIGAVPGDVIEITRHSDVGGSVLYWRYCVEDVNVA
jgi:DNA-directed RNA polymerase subunit H (RpoH/RPB5)